MGPMARYLGSQWQWDTQAVSQASAVLTLSVQPDTCWKAQTLTQQKGSRGRCVRHGAGPFAESDRLAAPTGGWQDTSLLTSGPARPHGTGHRRCCGSLKALQDVGELMAMR